MPARLRPMQPRRMLSLQVSQTVLMLLVLLCSLFTAPARARTVLDLDTQQQSVALKDWGDFWVDTSSSLSAPQVAANANLPWQPTQENTVYPLAVGQALWIRFTVPPAPDAERWYLEVPYPSINHASLFTLDAAGQWGKQEAGDQIPVARWPVPHRHPLMPLAVSAEVPSRYLLRLENAHSFGTQFRFVSESHLSHSEQRVSLILGIFFGIVGLAVLVSVMSALSLQDPAYGFYALSALVMGLTQATATGIAGLHLWPNSPAWNDASAYVLPTLSLVAKLLFVSAAISLSERSVRLHRTVQAVALLGVMVAAAEILVPMHLRMTVLMSYIAIPQALALYALVWAWRRGDRFAPWLVLGLAPMAISAMLISARNLGLLPVGFLTIGTSQISAAIELPIVMMILMLRSQHRRENFRRIQGLDRVDPSTGLINGQVFSQRLKDMTTRSERLRLQSAVMLIDIVNIKQTARDFGHKAALELPLRVAQRLLSTAREIDSAARLSEQRFGMLVEGPFDAADVAGLGPRIVARCLMPFKGMPPDCVAQVRVVCALVPQPGLTASNLVLRLDERLARAASEGDKRAVFVLTGAH